MTAAQDLAEIRVIALNNGVEGMPSVVDMVASLASEKEATINRVSAVAGLVGIEHERSAAIAEDLYVMIEQGASASVIAAQVAHGREHWSKARKPHSEGGE